MPEKTDKKQLKIGIMDADLLERSNHRFPNLVCEKISKYYKDTYGAEVALLFSYEDFDLYDKVFIAKVFTNTPVPSWLLRYVEAEYHGAVYDAEEPAWMRSHKKPDIIVGGTGFYFDKAPDLPCEIEHHMPDYHLYDAWIDETVEKAREDAVKQGKNFNESRFKVQFKEYLDYSIGFVTRGCFRKCGFCVNQKYDHSFTASPLSEFLDPERKKICLLDDNFLSFKDWRKILNEIKAAGKPFKFKQGLDERLLTDAKCKELFTSSYDGDLTFAFDNVKDYNLIQRKLKLIRDNNPRKGVMFYVLVGFKGTDAKDIENAFKRIELLFNYRCIPYLMRYISESGAPWKDSEFRAMYITMARWCNQPKFVKKMTFREFCEANQAIKKTDRECNAHRAMREFEEKYPEIAKKYFDIRFGEKTLEQKAS